MRCASKQTTTTPDKFNTRILRNNIRSAGIKIYQLNIKSFWSNNYLNRHVYEFAFLTNHCLVCTNDIILYQEASCWNQYNIDIVKYM